MIETPTNSRPAAGSPTRASFSLISSGAMLRFFFCISFISFLLGFLCFFRQIRWWIRFYQRKICRNKSCCFYVSFVCYISLLPHFDDRNVFLALWYNLRSIRTGVPREWERRVIRLPPQFNVHRERGIVAYVGVILDSGFDFWTSNRICDVSFGWLVDMFAFNCCSGEKENTLR